MSEVSKALAPHKHHFKPLPDKKVLLAKYVYEEGYVRYAATTGADTLKQRGCACGETETYDLTRNKL